MITLFDHTEPKWHSKYTARGRENGAATYSREIVKYQVPVLYELFNETEVIVSTCPLLSQVDHSQFPSYAKVAIQYLHSYPYGDSLRQAREVTETLKNIPNDIDHILFVTAYSQLADRLSNAGYDAIYLPMSVDTTVIPDAKREKQYKGKNIIYFGNVTLSKEKTFHELRYAFKKMGWQFNYISNGKLSGIYPLSQRQAWERINDYQYGIGVGRCALEMMAMGMNVLIAGTHVGGIMLNEDDYYAQRDTNFNGRITTFDREIESCAEMLPSTFVKTFDAKEAAEYLRNNMKALIHLWELR